ncbi:lipocalin family protein [Silanimonas sp.]|jgi:apolipoprotein D and lipocalin family protein|uniref:lipocalin family protein n=1 Tax=Silanimonas sp. TaxID=1929290 RepID=UPI0022C79D1F|nr:lipocalin family protein [Silanimonas sp.]MCZ8063043.1 lipocalin family protein [Silanimonas sp.]
MLRRPVFPVAILALGLSFAAHAEAAEDALPAALPDGTPNTPVPSLDLDRYAGRWHEVARLPMFFQRKCIGDTTATYTSRADGSIEVRNACRTEDGMIESTGAARRAGDGGALEVRFAPGWLGWVPMVWADYWVVDLDPGYGWAVVGGPKQGAMWILSRETTLDPALFERIRQRAEARGYRLAELVIDPTQRDRMVAE